jgi:hypothetical protein
MQDPSQLQMSPSDILKLSLKAGEIYAKNYNRTPDNPAEQLKLEFEKVELSDSNTTPLEDFRNMLLQENTHNTIIDEEGNPILLSMLEPEELNGQEEAPPSGE